MSKYNKKRNTAFIYEALIREVTKQSFKKDNIKRDLIISIIKEHFSKSTALYHDLVLYKAILDTKSVNNKFAIKLLSEVKLRRSKLNKKLLFKEQSVVISKINKNVSNSVFMNYVPTYKYLASIGQLFDDTLKPKAKVLLEENIIENMTLQEATENEKTQKLDDIVLKSFIKRFNNHYGSSLLEEQKQLLNKFITSVSDNGLEFKMYIDKEIERLKEALKKNKNHEEIIEDTSMKAKFDQILNFLNETHKHPLDEHLMLKVTQIQQLVNEIQLND